MYKTLYSEDKEIALPISNSKSKLMNLLFTSSHLKHQQAGELIDKILKELNLNIENFRITECGDLQDVVNAFNAGGIDVNTNESEEIPINLRA